MADDGQFRRDVEEQRANVVAWFNSGPGGIIAAVFILALVILLVLTAVGVL